MIEEPNISAEDTQPRPVVEDEFIEERPGCGNTILIGLVTLSLLVIFAVMVALAGIAGYRDGGIIRQTQKAAAIIGTIDRQATLAWGEIAAGDYELAQERCKYIVTQQPFYPEMGNCITRSQFALSATPTPTITPTVITPTVMPTATAEGGVTNTPEEFFARGEEAYRKQEYENAMDWFEALRGLDSNFRRREVEDRLVEIYQILGTEYKNSKRFSEMVVVIKRAIAIRPLPPESGWDFTVHIASLYLSGRDQLAGGNYAQAAQTFRLIMEQSPAFEDSKVLACEAFTKAGDTAALQQFCQ